MSYGALIESTCIRIPTRQQKKLLQVKNLEYLYDSSKNTSNKFETSKCSQKETSSTLNMFWGKNL